MCRYPWVNRGIRDHSGFIFAMLNRFISLSLLMRDDRTSHFQRKIDEAIENGWQVEEESTDRVVLRRPHYGKFAWHVVFLFLTLGLGNLMYAIYSYLENTERKVLRDEIDSLEDLKRLYATGRLDEREFERYLDSYLGVNPSSTGVSDRPLNSSALDSETAPDSEPESKTELELDSELDR